MILKRLHLFDAAAAGEHAYADSCEAYDFPRIAAQPQEDGTLRIMSYNIRCGDVNGVPAEDRHEIVLKEIAAASPDSLGIQEATSEWMRALDAALTRYDWVGINREDGGSALKEGESCPVFFLKEKFELVDSGNFWISDTPDVPSYGPGAACKRICTWAKLKDRRTGTIHVHVNTHFDNVSEEARVQGGRIVNRYIEEHFAGLPVVFTADMNTTDKGEAYATMTQKLADARFAAADCLTYGTFHAGKDPRKCESYYIDFVLCSSAFEVAVYRTVTAGIDGRFTSDHFPIYADLKFKE